MASCWLSTPSAKFGVVSQPIDAMRDAARLRFRPIVMTTLAMIAGMLPLALGHTIGAEYRQALGIVVIGGLSSSLLLTLLVVPIVYMAIKPASGAATKTAHPLVSASAASRSSSPA